MTASLEQTRPQTASEVDRSPSPTDRPRPPGGASEVKQKVTFGRTDDGRMTALGARTIEWLKSEREVMRNGHEKLTFMKENVSFYYQFHPNEGPLNVAHYRRKGVAVITSLHGHLRANYPCPLPSFLLRFALFCVARSFFRSPCPFQEERTDERCC